MTNRLLLRLHLDSSLSWLSPHGESIVVATEKGDSNEQLFQAQAQSQQIVVLVPAIKVLLIRASIVSRSRAQLLKAIPYALEDQLASPVEDLHFALPTPISAAEIGVAVVAREQMRLWLEQLACYGIKPDVMLPESLFLPWKEDRINVMIEDHEIIIRAGEWQCLTANSENLDQIIHILNAGHDIPRSLEIVDFRQASPFALRATVSQYHARQQDPLKFFAPRLNTSLPINLLQGEFAPHHRHVPAQTLWRYAAILFAAAIGLSVIYALIDRWQLQRESTALDIAMRDLLHESIPGIKRDDDPAGVMHSEFLRLQGGSSPVGLLSILGQIAPVLGGTVRATLKGMEYRNARLEIALRVPDVSALDALRERLALLPGLKAEVTAASPGDGTVEGRLRIEMTGAFR